MFSELPRSLSLGVDKPENSQIQFIFPAALLPHRHSPLQRKPLSSRSPIIWIGAFCHIDSKRVLSGNHIIDSEAAIRRELRHVLTDVFLMLAPFGCGPILFLDPDPLGQRAAISII